MSSSKPPSVSRDLRKGWRVQLYSIIGLRERNEYVFLVKCINLPKYIFEIIANKKNILRVMCASRYKKNIYISIIKGYYK